MNISKNLLSLGLIAVISGVSTAQTYTATAGTNGVTDIQSDYSQATGDGASVSVDVPLEFELPKKVAIAMNDGSSFTANPLFDGMSIPNSIKSNVLGGFADNPSGRISTATVRTYGAIYANTAVSLTTSFSDFLHESDTNSVIGARGAISLKDSVNNITLAAPYDIQTAPVFPLTINVDDTTLATAENRLNLHFWLHAYENTVDATDRAGKYTSIVTFTVSTL